MIYFDYNKNAYAYEIENYITTCPAKLWKKYAGTDKWDIVNGKFVDITNTEEYKTKKELEEKERVAKLNMTKLDFATYLQEYGVSYFQLKSVLASNDNAQMQWDLCERVYRFNPLLDELAKGFGITPEQLDTMFKKANGEVV
jgi:hypothetical protein